jgi:hypothetical protein
MREITARRKLITGQTQVVHRHRFEGRIVGKARVLGKHKFCVHEQGQIEALTAGLQKLSARLEVSKTCAASGQQQSVILRRISAKRVGVSAASQPSIVTATTKADGDLPREAPIPAESSLRKRDKPLPVLEQ